MTKVFEEIFTKANHWDYEKEYRIFKLLYPTIPSITERIISIPDNFYAEIILGLRFPNQEIDFMRKIAAEKKVPLFQVKKIPFEFKLDRVQLQ